MRIERVLSRRLRASLLLGLAGLLAGCGTGSGHSNTHSESTAGTSRTAATTSTLQAGSSSTAAGQALRVELQTPPGQPKAGSKWPVTIRAHTTSGGAVTGTVSYAFLFGGAVVSRRPGGQMRGGIFHDRLEFPAQALGYPLTLQVDVASSAGSGSTTRPVKVER